MGETGVEILDERPEQSRGDARSGIGDSVIRLHGGRRFVWLWITLEW